MQTNKNPFVISFLFGNTLNMPVSDVTVAGISPSSVVITWSALAKAAGYEVFVNPVLQTDFHTADNGPGIKVDHIPGSTTATVKGLVPGTEYYASVWAVTPVSYSRAGTFVTTQAPSIISFLFGSSLNVPVSDVTVAGISHSSVVISWCALAGAVDYEVFVNPVLQTDFHTADNGPGIKVKHIPGSTAATVSGLVSGTEYYASVWASTPAPSFSGGTVFHKLAALVSGK